MTSLALCVSRDVIAGVISAAEVSAAAAGERQFLADRIANATKETRRLGNEVLELWPAPARETRRLKNERKRKAGPSEGAGDGQRLPAELQGQATGEKELSPYFHIRYHASGRRVREATETTSRAEAERILREQLEDIEAGRPTGPQIDSPPWATSSRASSQTTR